MNCINNIMGDSNDALWVYPNNVVAMVLHNISNMCSCDLPDMSVLTLSVVCPCARAQINLAHVTCNSSQVVCLIYTPET